MPDVFLRGLPLANDVTLVDPTQVSGSVTVIPDTLSLTLTSFSPVVPMVVTVITLTLATSSFAPQIPTVVIPSSGALTTQAFAPVIPVQVTPASVGLTITGFAPKIPTIVTPPAGSLVINTFPPTIPMGGTFIPGTASLVITTFPPLLPVVVVPFTMGIDLEESAPNVQGSIEAPSGGGGYAGNYSWTNKHDKVEPLPKHEPVSVGNLMAVVLLRFRTELLGFVEPLEIPVRVKAKPQVKEIKVKAKLKSTGELNVLVPLPRFSFTGSVGIQGTVNLSARIRQLRFTGSVPSVVKEYNGIRFYNDDSLSFDVPEGYEVSVIIIPAGAKEYMDVPLVVLEPVIQSATENVK